MEELAIKTPDLVGRDVELSKLKQSLDNAISSKGSTIFISGEAGIGKTRLVSELIEIAESKGVQIIQGWCLAESLEPLMPIKSALREAGLLHLISGDPPPLVVSTYLMNDAGLLITRSEREELELDPQIFASMLKAVGTFVQDSMQMIDQIDRTGGLNILGYKEYKILVEECEGLHLITVTKGSLNEFLVNDMKEKLIEVQEEYGNLLTDWDGDLDEVEGVENIVSKLVTSGKYDGRFLIDDPKIHQENLFDSVLLGLQRLSSDKPNLLFLDDLQWADSSSLALLHYLARNTKENKTLILGTYRPEDIMESQDGKIHQLETAMQNMNREDLLEKMILERLGQVDTEKVMESTLGKVSFEKGFLDKVYRETEGTPFFLLEILKLLVEDGAIARREDGIWRLVTDIDKLDVPTKVYDVVKRRLDRLRKEQREILECASVVGEEFSLDVLEKTTEMRRLTLLKNLSDIEKSHKLIHYLKDKYRFDHGKIREVLYNGISEELRREYHRIVADTIAELNKENLVEVVSGLAHHYYKAGINEKAAKYLIDVGAHAWTDYGADEAIKAYERALEVAEDLCVKIDALLGLSKIHEFVGEVDIAIEESGQARGYAMDCGDKTLEAKVLLQDGKLKELRGDYDSAMELYERSLRIKEELEDGQGMAKTYNSMGVIARTRGDYDGALELYEKSLRIYEELGDRRSMAKTYGNMGIIASDRGDYDGTLELWEKSLQIYKGLGDKQGLAKTYGNMGIIAEIRGDYDRTLELYEKSLRIFMDLGDKRSMAKTYGNMGTIAYARGDYDGALEMYEESRDICKKMGDKQLMASTYSNIGEVYIGKDHPDKSLKYYQQSLVICLEIGEKKLSVHNYRGLATTYLDLGEVERALENAEKAIETSVEIGANTEEGISHRVLGMVYREKKDWDKSIEEFEKAKSIIKEFDNKEELARLFYEYGLLFKTKGETAKAKEHLEKALSMFEEMGSKHRAEKCRKALEEL